MLNIKVEIDDVDKTSYVRGITFKRVDNRYIQTIKLKISTAIGSIADNAKLEVWIGTASPPTSRRFYGYIEKRTEEGYFYNVVANDLMFSLTKRELTYEWEDTSGVLLSTIADYIIDNCGLPITKDGIQTTDVKVQKFWSDHEPMFKKLEEIRKTLDWQMYIDPETLYFHLEPRGHVDNSVQLEVGVNAKKIGKYEYKTKELVNELTMICGTEDFEHHEQFSGDGGTLEFQLSYVPTGAVRVLVGAVEQTPGTPGTTSNYDYVVNREREERKIVFEAGSCPGAGANNIDVYYVEGKPIVITGKDDESIANITHGVSRQKTDWNDFLKTREDAITYFEKRLSRYKQSFSKGKLLVKEEYYNIVPGETIGVKDSFVSLDDTFIARSVEIKWPASQVYIEFGDKLLEYFDETERLNQRVMDLEKMMRGKSDLLNVILPFYPDISISITVTKFEVYERMIGTAACTDVAQTDQSKIEDTMPQAWSNTGV